MTGVSILLDEHVGRVFEHVLSERGYEVEQAKDVFGERTRDDELLVVRGARRCPPDEQREGFRGASLRD